MDMCNIAVDDSGKIYDWIISGVYGDVKLADSHPNDLTLGLFVDKLLIAGVIYHNVNDICYITFYAKNSKWSSKKNLSDIFSIPFEVFNSKIVKCSTSDKNKRVNKLLWGLKFRHEGHLRFGRPDGTDENVFSITEKELKQKRWYSQ